MLPRESRREGCAALHPGQECWEGCADSVTCKVGRWPAECYRCVTDERNLLRWALTEIANRPTVERNPDGDDQAAATMKLIAREALEAATPGSDHHHEYVGQRCIHCGQVTTAPACRHPWGSNVDE